MDDKRRSLHGLGCVLVCATAVSLLLGFAIGGMRGGFSASMSGKEWIIRIGALAGCCGVVSSYLIRRIVFPIRAISHAMDRLRISITASSGRGF